MVGRDEEDFFVEISAFFDSRQGWAGGHVRAPHFTRSLGPDVLVSRCFPHHRLVYPKVSLAGESDPGDDQPWKKDNYPVKINIEVGKLPSKLT